MIHYDRLLTETASVHQTDCQKMIGMMKPRALLYWVNSRSCRGALGPSFEELLLVPFQAFDLKLGEGNVGCALLSTSTQVTFVIKIHLLLSNNFKEIQVCICYDFTD